MFVYRDEGPLLSLLKGGRGVLRGGVEFDCLDTGKSFTLTGQQMLKPTTHGCGSTAKPYHTKEVAVPRAFVTKRGHHVYLTAPEDMVVGSKCTLIERELQERERLCREVVDTTKTTTRLNEKALGFDEKEQKERDTLPPGHYNKFYVDYLAKNQPKSTEEVQDTPQTMEIDISLQNKGGGDADSGVGTSQVTSTDRLTPFSDATLISASSTAVLRSHDDQDEDLLRKMGERCISEVVGSSSTGEKSGKSKKVKSKKGTKGKKTKKTKSSEPSDSTKEDTSSVKKKKKAKSVKKSKDGEPSSSAKKQTKSSRKKTATNDSKEPCHGPLDTSWRGGKYSVEDELQSIQRDKDRLAQLQEEERQRRLAEEEKRWKKGEHNKTMRQDLVNLKVSQGITLPWKFSYFQYVPPKVPKGKEKAGQAKTRPKTTKVS